MDRVLSYWKFNRTSCTWKKFQVCRCSTSFRLSCLTCSTTLLQIPSTFMASQAMAFDGCFHDNDMELTPFPRMPVSMNSDPITTPSQTSDSRPVEGTRLRRQRSLKENVDLLVTNSYLIDSYSRLAFPLSYLLFNTIYWGLYS